MVTIKMSYTIVNLSRSAYYYQPRLADDSMIISLLKPVIDKQCFCYKFTENLPKIITRRSLMDEIYFK